MQLYTSVSAESSFSHPICPLFRVFALTCPQNGILCTLIVFMSGFCTRSSVHFLGYILEYTLIMANPPFTGSLDKETISKDLLAIAPTKKTELLFLALFLKALKVGGRCASIVPDGVLFGSSKAHKALRQELVEIQPSRGSHFHALGRIQALRGRFHCHPDFHQDRTTAARTRSGSTTWPPTASASTTSAAPSTQNDIPDIIQPLPSPRSGQDSPRAHRKELLRAQAGNRGQRLRPFHQQIQEGGISGRRIPAHQRNSSGAGEPAERDRRRTKGAEGDAIKP